MRVGIVAAPMPLEDGTSVAARLGEIGRLTEELDFSGLWITDSIGRAMASLDPLALLGAVAPVTSRIELGTCVLQIPLRHPVELAHRVMSLDVLSEGRLRLGIGAGSTEGDFQAVQADYQGRFKALTENLAVMRRTWQGEAIYGPGVIPWPGHEQGPPCFWVPGPARAGSNMPPRSARAGWAPASTAPLTGWPKASASSALPMGTVARLGAGLSWPMSSPTCARTRCRIHWSRKPRSTWSAIPASLNRSGNWCPAPRTGGQTSHGC